MTSSLRAVARSVGVTFVVHFHFERPLRNGEAMNQEAEATLTGQFDALYRAVASLLASGYCGPRPRRPISPGWSWPTPENLMAKSDLVKLTPRLCKAATALGGLARRNLWYGAREGMKVVCQSGLGFFIRGLFHCVAAPQSEGTHGRHSNTAGRRSQ